MWGTLGKGSQGSQTRHQEVFNFLAIGPREKCIQGSDMIISLSQKDGGQSAKKQD